MENFDFDNLPPVLEALLRDNVRKLFMTSFGDAFEFLTDATAIRNLARETGRFADEEKVKGVIQAMIVVIDLLMESMNTEDQEVEFVGWSEALEEVRKELLK